MNLYMLRLRKILLSDITYYILLFITIIYILLFFKNYRITSIYKETDTIFYLIIKDIKIDGDKVNLSFSNNIIGNMYFKTLEEKNNFNYKIGDKVKIQGILTKPSNNTIPNTFNYKKYLYHKGIKYIINIENITLIEHNKNVFNNIKNIIIDRVNNNEYLYAFILGKSSYIDSEVYNNYRINGITHLFALSGLHVSMFSSFLLLVFKKIKLNENLSYIITSLFLIFFSFIASFTPSILRAVIFFILSSINTIYYFYIKPKNILYLTFSILIFINPNYIYNTGFILSFTITFFILLFNEKYKINNKIISILVISIISFLSSLPIIINTSYEINIIGFINNLFFIPFVSYIVFPCALISIIFPYMIVILNYLTNIMEYISMISSNVLNLTIILSKMNYIEIIIFYILYIVILKTNYRLFLILFIFIVYLYIKPYFIKNNSVYFIDVGQGDSTLININNKSILIDTGGIIKYKDEEWKSRNKEFNLMNDNIIQFFKSIGIKYIDYLIITHGDNDHCGYALDLLNNFKVEKVIFNCGEFNDLEKELIKVLNKKEIKYYSCIKELNIDNNKLYFLQTKVYDNENDNSNVIYTELDGYKFMFMGDAGIDKEKDILDKYSLNNIDVLKVGHHGSKTSSSKSFIEEINPKYSVISVGKNNRYGHPNKEVLENLSESKIYRTDEGGSIMFKIKNNKLKIEILTS